MVDAADREIPVAGRPEARQGAVIARQVQVARHHRGALGPAEAFHETRGLCVGECRVVVGEVRADQLEEQLGVVDADGQRDAALEGVAVGPEPPYARVGDRESTEDRRPFLEA